VSSELEVVDLGQLGYLESLDLQRRLRMARIDGTESNDILLLVQHEPTYTLGRSTKESSLPIDREQLRLRGATVVEVERGGDVTWHGPGQLVGYPIINLSEHREDLHWYLRTLERALISALVELGVSGNVEAGKTGVWVEDRKIASIGIHVKQWVTLHGFALNVAPDLSWFDSIVPCGLPGVTMTSLRAELGNESGDGELWQRATGEVVSALSSAFNQRPVSRTATTLRTS
jgi:lipoate-protein ligase B